MCDKPAGSKWRAILQHKCPQCRRGKVFTNSVFNPFKFSKMHKNCPVCELQFELEPGYMYSAMYLSYMITSGACIMLGLAVYKFLHDPELWVYWSILITTLVLFSPISLRISRMLAIHLITPIRFDEKWR